MGWVSLPCHLVVRLEQQMFHDRRLSPMFAIPLTGEMDHQGHAVAHWLNQLQDSKADRNYKYNIYKNMK